MARHRLLGLLLLLAALPVPGQDPALRDSFVQAKGLWSNQGDREAAAAKFEQVIAALEPKARDLAPEWRQVLCEAYNWLAVLDDRNPASRARAARNLEQAIDLDPDFEIDRGITPSRLQTLYDSLRSSKLVKLKLTFEPDGGTLEIDGHPSPAQPQKHLPLGTHRLSYGKPGFERIERTVEAAAGDAPGVEFKLRRTSSTVTLFVSPPGAEVLLDGRSLGRATGTAGPEAADQAEKAGVKLDQLSAPFLIAELAPGEHVLELRAPCHRPKKIALPKEYAQPFQDLTLVPYVLEPARGTLALTSAWEGGEVYLNGERRGALPLPPLAVCAGRYHLEVRFPSGGYTQNLVVEDGQTLNLAVKPLPRMAYVGMEGDDDFTGKARLLAQFQALGERLSTVALLAPAGLGTPQQAVAQLKAARGAELFLWLAVRRDGSAIQAELVLATPDGEEERLAVKPLEADPLGALAARLNQTPQLQIPWTGLSLLDVPGVAGPWVLQADEAALQAGVQPRQPILAVDDAPVANLAAFQQALRQAKGDKVRITQAQGSWVLPVSQAPVELPLADPALSYVRVLADLRLRLLGAKGEAAGLLKFQRALALMHFRRYGRAVELLREVRLGASAGVGQGTVEYYTGLCLLRLGNAYTPEAIQAFTQALRHPVATLFGPEGPLIAPLAKQAIEDHKLN